MSSYQKQTKHPITGVAERAEWLDDYFGQHNYGVRFPSDGKVFRADEFNWQENPATMLFEGIHQGGAMTIEETHKGSRFDHPMQEAEEHTDGKRTVTTKHEDGRQDVHVEVTRLNIENRTPEDDAAEEVIIDKLNKTTVGVLLIHKPTNSNVYFTCPLPKVRYHAERAIEQFKEANRDMVVLRPDFILVESAVVTEKPKVTTL